MKQDGNSQDTTGDLQTTHPLEIAAQAGFGPISDKVNNVWHGESAPCVSCAMLNDRKAANCTACGQQLDQDMLQKMADHSGPWFVFEHIRPFPGISLERMIRQIKRGVLTRTSIVRGPTTYYQWRYATETPLVAKYLGRCWHCQAQLSEFERYCPECKVVADGHFRPQQMAAIDHEIPSAQGSELDTLGQLIEKENIEVDLSKIARRKDESLGKAPIIFFAIALAVVLTVVAVSNRGDDLDGTDRTTPAANKSTP